MQRLKMRWHSLALYIRPYTRDDPDLVVDDMTDDTVQILLERELFVYLFRCPVHVACIHSELE